MKAPEKTPSALSCAWFSLADVRYGVTLAGGLDKPLRFTVTVCEVLPVFASTTATAPLAGLTAVYLFGAVGPWLHALSPVLFR